ncbi:MAG: DNA-processing protein DprA [Clostridiales bacterium]|jgi:DNA processing protein|nr:DNA-processing protein DprA [Clostridiales bacterium]
MTDSTQNILYHLWLQRVKGAKLLKHFNSPQDIYNADIEKFAYHNIPPASVKLLMDKSLDSENNIIADCAKFDIKIMCINDNFYPNLLKQLTNPPLLLYYIGDVQNLTKLPNSIAVIGSRTPSIYAEQQTKRFATFLANSGFTIVSGMARGIDTIAHSSALSVNGNTIAVVGNGLDTSYPAENKALMKLIAHNGIVLSEYPPHTAPVSNHFPTRNRIISALSQAVLVMECTIKSGSMTSVDHARKQNKPIFTIPSNLDNIRATGNFELLKTNGIIATAPEDICKHLNISPNFMSTTVGTSGAHGASHTSTNATQKTILSHLNSSVPTNLDTLAMRTNLPIPTINAQLAILELTHQVKRLNSKSYIKIV